MTQAPSCETCKGTGKIAQMFSDPTLFNPHTSSPCPDCQPKPSEGTVSEADVLAVVSGLENVRCDLFSMSRPAVSAIQGKSIHLIERLRDELTQARAAIERQAGEIAALNRKLDQAEAVRSEEAFAGALADQVRDSRISNLEADLAAARLNAFDKAVADELPRVSHLEYDSHEICKHFAAKVRERIAAGDGK